MTTDNGRVEINGLVLAQMQFDMLNAEGVCAGLLTGHMRTSVSHHTTDSAEAAVSTASTLVITGYSPFAPGAFSPTTGVITPAALSSVPNAVGVYSFRRTTRILDNPTLREEALFDSLSANMRVPPVLMIFTSATESHTISFDFACLIPAERQVAYGNDNFELSEALPAYSRFARAQLTIANLVETTQTTLATFESSQPARMAAATAAAPAGARGSTATATAIATVAADLDAAAAVHVRACETGVERAVRVLGDAIARLTESEARVVALRREVDALKGLV
ncbi:hypothetical protein HDU83_001618 [Entophlyctis luteolus]|nr:hypothetical protein HDU83_001618 [Entophlyctis luteolus]